MRFWKILEPNMTQAEAIEKWRSILSGIAFSKGVAQLDQDLFQTWTAHMEAKVHLIPADNPRAYCRTAAVNLALEQQRKLKRRGEEEEFNEPPPRNPRREEQRRHHAILAEEALGQASAREAALLRKHYWDGQSAAELALEYGVSPTLIYQWIHRALAKLRKKLGGR